MLNEELILSIMIETYNQEKYISQTIDSILQQEYCFPYEIVIGDDCSTDKTPEILNDYASKYSQIKVIHNPKNLGAMGNFYNVLSQVKGKYIMDCAGDDYWLPGKVKTQISYMEKHSDVSMCYGKAKVFDESENIILKNVSGSKREKFQDLMLGNAIPALTVCIRKNVMDEYIADVNPEQKNWKMEDIPAWLWFAYNSKIKYINKIFGVYRICTESESHSKNEVKIKEFRQSCYEIRKFYSQKYNSNRLLNIYELNNLYILSKINKNRNDIIFYGKKLLCYKFSLRLLLRIIYVKLFY